MSLSDHVTIVLNSSSSSAAASPFWESSPSYQDFVIQSADYFSANWIKGSHLRFKDDFLICVQNVTLIQILTMISMALVWTILRHFSTKYIFKPFAAGYKMREEDAEKVPESGWKLIFYFISWIFCSYILLVQENGRYLTTPSTLWTGYSVNEQVTMSMHVMYMAQASFYLHSIYTSLFLDSWRKDSLVMLSHHVITIILLVCSLSARYHRPGLITIFLHDICDIILEATKICNYLTKQGNQVVKKYERAADLGFVTFAAVWFIARLYLFPLRVIYYSSIWLEFKSNLNVPFGFFLNSLLYLLLCMNIYWFSIILSIMYKVIRGEQLEDSREEIQEKEKKENYFKNGKKLLSQKSSFNARSHSIIREEDEEEEEKEEEKRIQEGNDVVTPHYSRNGEMKFQHVNMLSQEENEEKEMMKKKEEKEKKEERDNKDEKLTRKGYLLRARKVVSSDSVSPSGRSE